MARNMLVPKEVMTISQNGLRVLEARYLRRDSEERITAEVCVLLGISYASDQAILLADQLMEFIARQARLASERLEERRGVFPSWTSSTYKASGVRLRNATQMSIAPTGTISIIAGTSSSIEPFFALAYRRKHVLGEQTLAEFNPVVLRHLARLRLDTPEPS